MTKSWNRQRKITNKSTLKITDLISYITIFIPALISSSVAKVTRKKANGVKEGWWSQREESGGRAQS